MRRRDFITFAGCAAATWPLAVRAQHTDRMRTVSMLLGVAEKDPEAINRVKAFRLGMRDLGWIEGRNVQIEYRFAGTDLESINKNVAEVVQLKPTSLWQIPVRRWLRCDQRRAPFQLYSRW